MAKKQVGKSSTKDTDDNGKTSSRTVRGYDDGSAHVTTAVDIPGVGSIRSSYNIDKDGNASDQHMTKQK
jgi:hypothetical protein